VSDDERPRLNPEPARELTLRECVKILGGTIGGLADMSDLETLRAAVKWWANTDAAWDEMQKQIVRAALAQPVPRKDPT
jgi:hypothetical protein